MKQVATESGRTLQLLVPDEIRPQHGYDLPIMFQKVAVRYGFLKTPNAMEGFSPAIGARFENGRFPAPGGLGEIPIAELSLFNDGIIVTAADTNLASLFANEALEWLISIGAIRRPETVRPQTHTSTLVVQFEKRVVDKLDSLLAIATRFDNAVLEHRGPGYATHFDRLGFAAEPDAGPQSRLLFSLERRKNGTPIQDRFWSTAPLPYGSHMALLEEIEADLASNYDICAINLGHRRSNWVETMAIIVGGHELGHQLLRMFVPARSQKRQIHRSPDASGISSWYSFLLYVT